MHARILIVLRLNTIFGFKYRASTRPRLLAFKIHLENESRVRTPIRRNLKCWFGNLESSNQGWHFRVLTYGSFCIKKDIEATQYVTILNGPKEVGLLAVVAEWSKSFEIRTKNTRISNGHLQNSDFKCLRILNGQNSDPHCIELKDHLYN